MIINTIWPEARSGESDEASNRRDLQRSGMKRLLLTLPPYTVAMTMLIVAMELGLVLRWQAALVGGYAVVGLGTFYLLLRRGVALGSRDPMLIYPQLLFGISLVALSYTVMDVTRGVVMEWLSLLIVFDMQRLARRQTLVAAALAMALPVVGVVVVWWLNPTGLGLGNELFFLSLSAVLVPVLLLVSASARAVGRRQIKLKEGMAAALEQMRQLSMRDGLTGLYNRRHILGLLEEEDRRLHRTGRQCCVAMLDIDLFKRVNDELGHAMGDTVLRQFSALGRTAFQNGTDSLARWGGEEFLLLMPETSPVHAHAALMRLRAMVHAYDWSQHHPSLKVTFSAGVCEHRKEISLAQALAAADEALYRAKAAGRDRVESFRPLTDAERADSAAAQSALPTAPLAEALLPPAPTVIQKDTPEAPASAATALPASSGSEVKNRLVDWVLGREPKVREAIIMCLLAAATWFCVLLAEILHAIPSGMMPLKVGMVLVALNVIGIVVPYALVRSGVTARLKDSSIAVPQMLWALLSLTLAYGFVPATRSYDLQLTCVVLTFGFINLRPRQAIFVGASAIGMFALMFGWLLYTRPDNFMPIREGLVLTMTLFVMAWLTWLSRNFAMRREAVRKERRDLAAATEKVKQLTMRDTLTGLFNRQCMQDVLEHECHRHDRSGHSFCVALIDLDHFKRVNDSRGHQVGDEALVGFAQAAQRMLRDTDVIARWGGEEFLLVLSDTEPGSQGLLACERLRGQVAAQRLCPSAPDLTVTFSAGLAERRMGEPLGHLLERVDQALYAAKAQGRNCVRLADQPELTMPLNS
ncbi:MAG: GGDEF domain-containing protein [Aquabacterium sp.]|uniref:GGDEF domain-containing protein n=1 Tax=Aquabacterium sp. TaxID=1872578 RepID=UPI002727A1F9|nr:GGDEF domain-containing protein [Aquabacterium sp.]MDO9002938.1 GGDEF domain-containing protein [Aquabacterium sp.]